MVYYIISIIALIVFLLVFIIAKTLAFRAGEPIKINEPVSVQGDADAVSKRLSGAIKFKTIAYAQQERIDGSQFNGLHEYLRASYPLVSAKLSWDVVNEYSLLLTWKGRGGTRPIALLAHMDVVPVMAGTELDWSHDAFGGHFDGEYVWGRGAIDMKGHLIAVLEATEGLLRDGFQPANDVYLCFGHNEEIVSAPASGAKAIMERFKERGIRLETIFDEGGFVMPGTQILDMPGSIALIGTAEKGSMDVRLSCAQEGGHASQPPKTTALGILARALVKLEKNPLKPRLIGLVQTMLMTAGRRMGFVKSMMLANLWLFRPLLFKMLASGRLTNALSRTTLAATMAAGSPAPNVLPQKAEVVINARILPGENMAGTVEEIRRIIGDDRVTIELINGRNPSAQSSEGTDGYKLIKSTLSSLYPNVTVAPFLMVGGTDSCLYQPVCENIYRISPFMLSSEELKTLHGTNERISKTNLLRAIEFFRQIILNSK